MIDYFIHFINIHFHLIRINRTSSVNHRTYFADQFRNLLYIHSCFPGNSVERAFIIFHFFNIYLNLPPKFFGQIGKLLSDQIRMIFLLKVKCTYQFGKFKRLIGRFLNNRDSPLPSLRSKYHEEYDGNHCQI